MIHSRNTVVPLSFHHTMNLLNNCYVYVLKELIDNNSEPWRGNMLSWRSSLVIDTVALMPQAKLKFKESFQSADSSGQDKDFIEVTINLIFTCAFQ